MRLSLISSKPYSALLVAIAVATTALAATPIFAPQTSALQAQASAPAAPPPAQVQAPGAVGFGPNGATLRCRDGSYPAAGAPDSACEDKGGILVRFPTRPVRPARPVAVSDANAAVQAPEASRVTPPPAGFVPFAEFERRVAEERARGGRPPEGATLLCQDGTYVVRDTASLRCQQKGGVRVRLEPQPRPDR